MADLDSGDGSGGRRSTGQTNESDRFTSAGDHSPSDRAQLVLIGGLILAFTIVALTLVVNSVLYTDNVESRSTLPVAENAEEFTATVEESIARVITEENRREWNGLTGPDPPETEVETDLGVVTRLLNTSELEEHGAMATVDGAQIEEGKRVGQPASGTLDTGTDDWYVVNDTDGVRNVTFTVDPSSLPVDPSDKENSSNGAFHVDVIGPSDTWTAFVYRNSADYTVLDVKGGPTCKSPTSNTTGTVVLDMTEGAIRSPNGTGAMQTATCDYRFAEGLGDPYDIRFANGDRASGTFDMVVDEEPATAVTCAPASVSCTDAVYSVSVDVTYDTETFSYNTTVRVAPGEPRTVAP
jgi:hypothetical protein